MSDDKHIFSDCGNAGGKAVRIRASLMSYTFIEHCLWRDPGPPPEDNASTILRTENAAAGEERYRTIHDFLGFSEEESRDFDKWYGRRVKPYCRANGLSVEEYPISPPLLLEIARHRDSSLDDVFTYFEHYCTAWKGHVTAEHVADVAAELAPLRTGLDGAILEAVLEALPGKLGEYRSGKTGLLNMFFGEYLKRLPDKNVDKNALRAELASALG